MLATMILTKLNLRYIMKVDKVIFVESFFTLINVQAMILDHDQQLHSDYFDCMLNDLVFHFDVFLSISFYGCFTDKFSF